MGRAWTRMGLSRASSCANALIIDYAPFRKCSRFWFRIFPRSVRHCLQYAAQLPFLHYMLEVRHVYNRTDRVCGRTVYQLVQFMHAMFGTTTDDQAFFEDYVWLNRSKHLFSVATDDQDGSIISLACLLHGSVLFHSSDLLSAGVIQFGNLTSTSGKAVLANVATRREYRGMGWGSRVVEEVLKQAPNWIRDVYVLIDPQTPIEGQMREFYERLGFQFKSSNPRLGFQTLDRGRRAQ